MLLLTSIVLSGCASPSLKNDRFAQRQGWKQQQLSGIKLTHRIYFNRQTAAREWHVYLEGDGRPWRHQSRISLDPATTHPLMLRLMAMDDDPSIYLTRPCYNSELKNRGCNPWYWTQGRYSLTVVEELATVLQTVIEQQDIRQLVLIGHSGGGTLAVLLADRIPQTRLVVTLAANLDIDSWADQHGYTRLTDSLNPATEANPAPPYRQLHYIGARDRNVTPAAGTRSLSENREPTAEKLFWPFSPLIFVKYSQYSPQISEKNGLKWLSLATTPILGQPPRRTGAGFITLPDVTHTSGWEAHWPAILQTLQGNHQQAGTVH
jgi:pimeloyl-ACP methyl ester carboxylesterase